MKTIKRYANRRLYDAETSKTITLDEVAAYLRSGQDLQVIDSLSGEDITSKVLGQTFLKIHEPNSNEPFVNFILKALIRESEQGFFNVVKKLFFSGIGIAKMQQKERNDVIENLLKTGKISKTTENHLEKLVAQSQIEVDNFLGGVMGKIEEVRGKVESSLKNVLEPVDKQKEIDRLKSEIIELKKQLEETK